jgi:hypothetical protein
VTTYIAAEFTWPDSSRVETWGLRFEYHNTSETDGSTTPFFCPATLERADFLTISEDGKPRPSPLAAFKRLIDAKGGRLFSSTREYLRDMANPSHLNFNKEVLHRLLPSAMSFTNLKSFDEFCRQFVLPAEAVDVDAVITSFRDFQSYEKELADLRAQLELAPAHPRAVKRVGRRRTRPRRGHLAAGRIRVETRRPGDGQHREAPA